MLVVRYLKQFTVYKLGACGSGKEHSAAEHLFVLANSVLSTGFPARTHVFLVSLQIGRTSATISFDQDHDIV